MADGRVLNERYELGASLGRGGMASVYRGTDRVLGRTVAVKVLADRFAGDDKFVTRFRREAQAAAGLNHPNVVSVFDTGDDAEAHYIVMEFVEGDTLADVLRREGKLAPGRAVAIADDAATALQAAHDSGLVHRDVKPGNIMIDREARVKVMDFGIARAAADDTLTQTGMVLGTASYLSPEQAQGMPVDARSDVYSLGCVLYEMLAGQPPFTGESPVAIAYKHVNEDPAPLSETEPKVSPQLEAVVMRALAKEPDRRFPTAQAFREALADAVSTEPMPVAAGGDTAVMPPTTTPMTAAGPPQGPPDRGRNWIPIALLVAALIALIGIVALTLAGQEEPGQRQRPQQEAESPPPEEESPPPALEAASPEEAFGVLEAVVTDAVGSEQMTFGAAEDVLSKADEAANKYAEGDVDKALEELGKAHEEVDKNLGEGEIASEETASTVHEAINLVAATIEASAPTEESPPPEEEGDGDGDGDDD
jgi:Protein kinase domain